MRAKELLREFGDDETVSNDNVTGGNDNVDSFASLLTVLQFLKTRSQENNVPAKMKTASLINMVKNAGDESFGYEDLVAAQAGSPAVKNLIKDMNQDEVILAGDSDDASLAHQNAGPSKNPQQTVSNMANKALNKRN